MRQYKYLAFFLLLLTACAAIEAPRTFDERLAYGYASLAATRNTAASMLERGRLTKADGRNVQKSADTARTALDVAGGAFKKGDTKTAESNLQLALSILTQLERTLKEKQ